MTSLRSQLEEFRRDLVDGGTLEEKDGRDEHYFTALDRMIESAGTLWPAGEAETGANDPTAIEITGSPIKGYQVLRLLRSHQRGEHTDSYRYCLLCHSFARNRTTFRPAL